jgi:hypothetical protein
MYSYLREVTLPGGEYVVRNFVGVIEDIGPEASTVETDLFPRGALEYYSKKNMGWDYTPEEYDTWWSSGRLPRWCKWPPTRLFVAFVRCD